LGPVVRSAAPEFSGFAPNNDYIHPINYFLWSLIYGQVSTNSEAGGPVIDWKSFFKGPQLRVWTFEASQSLALKIFQLVDTVHEKYGNIIYVTPAVNDGEFCVF
jgi:hypothetical protein